MQIAELSRELSERIDRLLAASPAPEAGRRYLNRFPAHLITSQNARCLVAIFTHSNFLSEDLVEHPEWIEEFRDLDRVLGPEELRARLDSLLPSGLPGPIHFAMFR